MNEIKIVNNKPISARDLWGVTTLARTNPECEFNKDVQNIYDTVLTTIMRRATQGFGDYNLNEHNCPWCGYPSQTEALRRAMEMLAEKHKFNISWYWDKNTNYTCKVVHIDWENEGNGSLRVYTI